MLTLLGSDVDPVSVALARENVELNGWVEDIKVKQVEAEQMLYGVVAEDTRHADVTLASPAFLCLELAGRLAPSDIAPSAMTFACATLPSSRV